MCYQVSERLLTNREDKLRFRYVLLLEDTLYDILEML